MKQNKTNVIGKLLVIAYDDESVYDIADKYSNSIEVEPYLFFKKSDISNVKTETINSYKSFLNDSKFGDVMKEYFKEKVKFYEEMSDEEFFEMTTEGCQIDEETGDAYKTDNLFAKYEYAKCHQKRLEKTGEESDFSNPFTLKNGKKSYIAKYNDINWEVEHLNGIELYEAAWELCVDEREPKTEQEKAIKNNMSNRKSYFENFKNKEEYSKYSTSFSTFAVATSEKCDIVGSEPKNVIGFYDKYIKPIEGNPTLAIFEIRLMY